MMVLVASAEDADDVRPEADEQCDQRAEMDGTVEHTAGLGIREDLEPIVLLCQRQMPRTADRKELGQPLYDAEDECREDGMHHVREYSPFTDRPNVRRD